LRLKNQAWSSEPGGAVEAMRRHQIELTELAVKHEPQLIVWPETSWPGDWGELQEQEGQETLPIIVSDEVGQLRDLIKDRWRTDVLPGLNTVVINRQGKRLRRYNSAVLIGADGGAGGRYDKIHRVPFGEYIPLRDWLPFMEWFSPYNFDYSIRPGERLT